MRAHISAKIEQETKDRITAMVDAGVYRTLSEAIAALLEIGLGRAGQPVDETALRRILREELAQVSIQQQPVGGQPANPKLGKLLSKTVR